MEYIVPDEENSQANEPELPFGIGRKMKLRIFGSFEEAAEAEAIAAAQQKPVERLRETVELILRAYGVTREQLMARDKKLNLTITAQG